MSPEEFIRKHIADALVGEGFPEQVALGGAGWPGPLSPNVTGKP